MILYKYLQPARVDVLKQKRIRFTQPGDFNDPFEFRPRILAVASEESVRLHAENNFDQLVDRELAKYGEFVGEEGKSLLQGDAAVAETFGARTIQAFRAADAWNGVAST